MVNVVLNGGNIRCKSIKIMAKNNTIKSNKKQSDSKKRNYKFSFLTAFIFLLSISLILSLFSFEPSALHAVGSIDTVPQSGEAVIPLLGKFGNYLAYYTIALFGTAAWLLPFVLISFSFSLYSKTSWIQKCRKIGSMMILIISTSTFSTVNFSENFNVQYFTSGPGGYLGCFLYFGLPFTGSNVTPQGVLGVMFGPLGTNLLCSILGIIAFAIHFSLSFTKLNKFTGIYTALRNSKLSFFSNKRTKQEENPLPKTPPQVSLLSRFLKVITRWNANSDDDLLFSDVSKNRANTDVFSAVQLSQNSKVLKNNQIETEDDKPEIADHTSQVLDVWDDNIDSNIVDDSQEKVFSLINEKDNDHVEMDGFKVVRAAKTEKAGDLFPERKGDYHFPTLDLLMDPPEEVGNADDDHMEKARNLKETLSQFKVDIELGEVHTGPVITRYDVHPAAGVRVEKIANLDKNLAMALRADSVRILAPVPGKGCVGIEVPNSDPAAVCLKEILQSKAWADSGAEIPIVLGKEASGKALVADLTKMPHLLVAGSTGSGKTVCINAIIASLCYYSSPEDVRFIMVDPKIVEMKIYNDLPHMLIPVVTEPKKVPGALKWLLIEMERRYQIFSKVGVRNIAGFNAKILKDKEEKEKAQLLDAEMTAEERAALSNIQVPRDDDALEIPENKLPYIVCIIDELADLMMVAQADVETGIARLAQLARAAGIHLIIATQRPSVNVITGVIKANLPSRISFRVASYRDSQTILDGKGAEALIGKGDMLFIPPGSSTFVRAQGAFVSDDEINGIVDYLKINGPPEIIEEVREQIESAGDEDVLGQGGDDSDEDPMVRKAIEVIRTTKRASTSNLQRKLSIGYNRAARIMDDLEDRGLIGPDVPGQGREILMDL